MCSLAEAPPERRPVFRGAGPRERGLFRDEPAHRLADLARVAAGPFVQLPVEEALDRVAQLRLPPDLP